MNRLGVTSNRPAGGLRGGEWIGVLGLATILVFGGGGCPPISSALLGPYADYLPSVEDLQRYEQEWNEFNAQLENLPQVSVRIINNTAAPARVVLAYGLEGPEYPGEEFPFSFVGSSSPYLEYTQEHSVLVAPNGTASGKIGCGDVIGIAAFVPVDSYASFDSYDTYDPFGLYLTGGNVALAGVGQPVEEAVFTGDVVYTVRFVRPAEDGLDCAAERLVITIDTAATESVYDGQGKLVTGAVPGTGTVAIEAK